ncbi:MAG: DUF2634 domain-containing protein [Myxococcales bacterium]|nr:DUF2634 domain-containing protein [Myxococcales bacterium]
MTTDLRLRRSASGRYDLDVGAGDVATVAGRDLLVQALTLRLVCVRGELTRLGHPRYGSTLHTFVGQPRDRESLGLMRRLVHKTLLADPRVREVVRLDLRTPDPSTVEILATVRDRAGEQVSLEVHVDA